VSSVIALPPPIQITIGERVRGLTALAAARVILTTTRARPAPLTRVLTSYADGARPATFAQAERAHAVITTLSPRCGSGRHCLIRATAVALFCRTAGTWPTWRSGVRFPPLQSHAWVEADGRPVGEDAHTITGYAPTITITARPRRRPG
jgi:hypothetical protein